jgi:hypothetical protein
MGAVDRVALIIRAKRFAIGDLPAILDTKRADLAGLCLFQNAAGLTLRGQPPPPFGSGSVIAPNRLRN